MHVMVATAARPTGCAEAARLQCLGLGHRAYVDLVAVDSLPVRRRPRGGFLLASARGPVIAGSSPEPGAAALNNEMGNPASAIVSLRVCRPSRLGSFDSLVSAASPAQIPRCSCSASSCPSHWMAVSLCLFGGLVARPVVASQHLLDRISRNVIGEMEWEDASSVGWLAPLAVEAPATPFAHFVAEDLRRDRRSKFLPVWWDSIGS
ncbi:hypothetical protein IWX90DRAFT_122501 [Phyllosticta citrichinensis]|uniref:Uncharacterized protein n=1 Tax=Phyllosticta citrichinensis TaxID=1130410 RepID=A0ABR1Y436_9PEZI